MMNAFSKQRWIGLSLFVLLSALTLWLHARWLGSILRLSFLTGWSLFAVILCLTFYNPRKKLPFLPLFSSEAWLQFHIYAGLLTGVLFAVHISFRVPAGWFETILAWLYVLVMLSGFFGLFVSRTLPRRLTARGGEVLFERIPAIRRELRERAEALALKSISEGKSPTIAEFYSRELRDFFEGQKNLGLHLFEVSTPLNRLLSRIRDLNRFVNEQERVMIEQLVLLVRQKDGLDYHYSLQLALKTWLFVHIPLTYSLLLFTLVHIVLVFAFSGGAH
jgi:hypothetical protein